MQLNIPYRVYGGMRFFDRAEIKDALSYLRLVTNPNDDVAFERASSMPPKGMGAKTMSQIRTFAKEHNVSLLSAASSMLQNQELKARASASTNHFLKLIDKIKNSLKAWNCQSSSKKVLSSQAWLLF